MIKDLKVINLGLPKSGTTTLGTALGAAGLTVADWRIRRGDENATAFGFVGNLMYHSYFKTGDPLALMPNYQAFAEIDIVRKGFSLWPQTDWGLISAIREHHPGARFVLTCRDAAKQSDSMGRWSDMGSHRLPNNNVPGMPLGYGGNDKERIRWINGHRAFCNHVFKDADDYLECPIEDEETPERLAKFLDIKLSWWGTANANKNRPAATSETEA